MLIFKIVAGFLLLYFVLNVIFAFTRFRRCPPGKLLIIYGKVGVGKRWRILKVGGAFVWPIIQSYRYLDLAPIQVTLPLNCSLKSTHALADRNLIATVGIATEGVLVEHAADRLPDMKHKEIATLAASVIAGSISKLPDTPEEPSQFLRETRTVIEADLSRIGIEVISLVFQ